MTLSQKCQYAIRALYELAAQPTEDPVPLSTIAQRQAIPPRFLELILRELRQGGFVESRRGAQGGYLLARDPQELNVGEVIRFIDGELTPVRCAGSGGVNCPLSGRCAFRQMWRRAYDAVNAVYDATSFQSLVDEHGGPDASHAVGFCN